MTELEDKELEEVSGGNNGVTANPVGRYKIHVVKNGECLSLIAVKYGTTVEILAKLNNIPNPDVLRVGQKLMVPNPAFNKDK